MKDYYLYDDVPVLRNLLNIKDEKLLLEAESNITYVKLLDKNDKIKSEKFDYDRLKAVHLSEYQYLTRIIKDTIING